MGVWWLRPGSFKRFSTLAGWGVTTQRNGAYRSTGVSLVAGLAQSRRALSVGLVQVAISICAAVAMKKPPPLLPPRIIADLRTGGALADPDHPHREYAFRSSRVRKPRVSEALARTSVTSATVLCDDFAGRRVRVEAELAARS
jgi:hypothetical protein